MLTRCSVKERFHLGIPKWHFNRTSNSNFEGLKKCCENDVSWEWKMVTLVIFFTCKKWEMGNGKWEGL
jgi:hypothetical protein